MVEIPEMLSLNIANIGDLARPSNLFNSREVVTKILLTERKYLLQIENS